MFINSPIIKRHCFSNNTTLPRPVLVSTNNYILIFIAYAIAYTKFIIVLIGYMI